MKRNDYAKGNPMKAAVPMALFRLMRRVRTVLVPLAFFLVSCTTEVPAPHSLATEPGPLSLAAEPTSPTLASGPARPPSRPFLRLETGSHTARINCIAVDSKEQFLVTGSNDKTARVWDLQTGELLRVLRPPLTEGHEGKIYALAISPDGQTVALGGHTGRWEVTDTIYLFDRNSGELIGRLTNLPNAIRDLAFSSDGQHLAASLLGANGVRVFRLHDGQEVARDVAYGDHSYSVDFDRQGRLVTTSNDGALRLYDSGFQLIAKAQAPGGQRPAAARFSPDGRRVAVGFYDSTAVNVLSGDDLSFTFAPDTAGVDNGSLAMVAWSRDGRHLHAGGRYDDGSGLNPIISWGESGRGAARHWRAGYNTLMDLEPLADGGLAFGAQDPVCGVLDSRGRALWRSRDAILDLRHNEGRLRLSHDGTILEFGFVTVTEGGQRRRRLARIELAERQLRLDPPHAAPLAAPETRGEPKANWKDTTTTTLAGRALRLEPDEISRSLAFAPGRKGFVLGTGWWLRFYEHPQNQLWQVSIPGVAWAVNLSADGHYAVAALGDGTIRWYHTADGHEVLALFVHPDGKRWIAWTPEGFFDAVSGAEELVGYHLNRSSVSAGEFVAADQLMERYYRPDLIARVLQPGGEQAEAEAAHHVGAVHAVLSAGLPPRIELLSPAQSDSTGEYLLKIRIEDRGGGIGSIIYRIDGVEIQGRPADIPIAGADTASRRFELAAGRRVLTASVTNAHGIESKPVRVLVNVKAPKKRPALFALAVGVTEYYDSDLRLKYAAADAIDIKKTFEQYSQALFPRGVHPLVLTDEGATKQKIRQAFAELAAQARSEDTFVLYLAGHGTVVDGKYYFLPYEIEYENEAALRSQGLSEDDLRQLLAGMPAQSLLLLDTCRSGAAITLASRSAEDKGAINRLMKRSGRSVIAASNRKNIALEGYKGHGVFTYAVLQALEQGDYDHDGDIDVDEIAMHVKKVVPEITLEKFKHRQIPMRELHGGSFPITRPARRSPTGR